MASTAVLVLALLVVLLLPPITLAGDLPGFRATLTRIQPYSPGTHSAAVRRDSHRLALLSYASAVGAGRAAATNSSTSIQALVENGPGAYLMNLSVGTPPFTFPAVVDTGSDLTWTQCAPCTKCFPRPTPNLFQPAGSSSFSKLSCNSSFCQSLSTSFRTCNATGCVYDYRYGKGYTDGYLAAETLTVGGDSFSNFAFGCSTENGVGNLSGLVGLARSPLSLVSQLGVGRFSYCLRSDMAAGASPILFGSLAKVTGGKVQTTPFVRHPALPASPFYYVNLTGITVGSTDLPVTSSTFGFTRTGSGGGTIVDSGTTFTYLAEAGYAMVKQSFQSQLGNLTTVTGERAGGLDLCFEVNGGDVAVPPKLVLRFAGAADYDVPVASYIGAVEVDSQGRPTVECLLLLPSKDISIVGNVLQMDLHVLYDLDGEKFSFAPADCAKV
ncbi:hypothetical protein GUJ93_ZPchr0007g4334 [Zizania palustris]|uniref:Peptidase A1 domain-containing protein n=1 Tax=Zizania palustris TaxID=103762 RepID=A0A8J5VTS0_ZIZPA|nr:hypothetical protein GUJ93_ZPchr0007g4334 [Zizania palustris]